MKRSFSLLFVLVLLTSLLAACAPVAAPAPQIVKETVVVPVKETVVVPVKETVVVEVPAPAAEAAAPAAAPAAEAPAAAAEGPVTLEVYDPTGAIEVTQLFSARLDTLEGKTICEVSDEMWEADRTFPAIRDLLQKMYPTVKILTWDQFPTADGGGGDNPEMGKKLVEAGCDAAIVGNAG